MKIRFENMKLVIDNGLIKIKYTLGSLALSLACIGLYIYVFKKFGWKGLITLLITAITGEAGAYGLYFYMGAIKNEENWFTRLYSKAADWVGFSWSPSDLEEEE